MHLPFCARRCPYCDFATAPLDRRLEERYLEALAREASERLPPGWRPQTVFLGGGTPAELTTPGLTRLVEVLQAHQAHRAREVTVEGNPRTLLPRKLAILREGLGKLRVSLGSQSFQPRLLRKLGRFHTPADTRRAVAHLRTAGVEDLNLDLMFAIPGQTEADLDADLDALLALEPEHVSTYCLTFEEETEYGRRLEAGTLRPPGGGRAAGMFARVRRRLRAAGYVHYEISNFARPGRRCRHNIIYWRNHPYFGLGVGAASHLDGVRTTTCRDVAAYCEAVEAGRSPAEDREELEPERKVRETAYLALRTSAGIVPERFQRETGVDPRAHFAEELSRLQALGLLVDLGERIRLTGKGVTLADAVGRELL